MKMLMSTLLAAVVALSTALAPDLADAKRLGGGRSSGMQRDMPARTSPDATPAKPAQAPGATPGNAAQPGAAAQAGNAATGAAAAAGKRSWLGPIAGLAAGLGLAALASHFGFGEGLANIMMIALLVMAAFALFAFISRRMAGPASTGSIGAGALAGAGAGGAGGLSPVPSQPAGMQRQAADWAGNGAGAASAGVASSGRAPVAAAFVPAAFDSEGFARAAKAIFIRMQAANDAGNLDDLRQFTTPEMFAQVKLDLMDRGSATQTTDVRHVDAKVLDVSEENGQQIVSVRYSGKLVEEAGGQEALFDEVWHLVKAPQGDGWLIAGIEQMS
jgi:predicted lipid-binding transport protein (Tim44 family)